MTAQIASEAAPAAPASHVDLGTKLSFGLGQSAEGVIFTAFETFTLFYYTRVMGLSGAMAGLAILLALIVDAVFDPIFGGWCDQIRSRLGRRHAPMFAAVLPVGIALTFLYAAPVGLGRGGLFAWLVGFAVLLRLSYTVFSVPYASQHAELTGSQTERAWMGMVRTIMSTLANIAFLFVAFQVFFKAGPGGAPGQENAAAYRPFGLTLGLAMMAVMLVSALGTRRRMRQAEAADRTERRKLSGSTFAELFRVFTQDRNFRVMILGGLAFFIAISAGRGLSLHLGGAYWKFNAKQLQTWQQALFVGSLTMVTVTPFLVRRLGVKRPWITGLTLYTIASFLPLLLGLLGALRGLDAGAVAAVVVACQAVSGMGMGIHLVCIHVVTAQLADEYEFITAATRTGLLFGTFNLTQKLAGGLGKLFGGIILDAVHFPAGRHAAPPPPSVVDALAWSQVGLYAVVGGIAVLVYSRYRLDPDRRRAFAASLGR